jgi:heme/copper-type cytochrome/quinol oxidase subunit 2
MSKLDRLKEEKSDLKEIFKALIYLILAILTGIGTIVYKIFVGSVPVYTIVLGGIGLIIVFLLSIYALNLWNKMQEINREMENE